MKKIALFLLMIVVVLGCSIGEKDTYSYQILPVESYTLPASFTLGQTYSVTLTYQKPTVCYQFQDIFYAVDANVRTIGIQTATKNGEKCSEILPPLSTFTFNFTATSTGSYIFKFYKGKNDADEDVFEEVEIPVVE